MFTNRTKKTFLTEEENEVIMTCIREHELRTSGEIRICIESRCSYMDPIERAKELFLELNMWKTPERNGVLIYIAYKDKDFALLGDEAIFKEAHPGFWATESKRLGYYFFHHHFVKGITTCVTNVGDELEKHFPRKGEKKNELPDEIIFGK